MTSSEAEVKTYTLRAELERCDRCRAPRHVTVRRIVNGVNCELVLCKHHYVEAAKKLLDEGWVVFEEKAVQ